MGVIRNFRSATWRFATYLDMAIRSNLAHWLVLELLPVVNLLAAWWGKDRPPPARSEASIPSIPVQSLDKHAVAVNLSGRAAELSGTR